MMGQAFSEPVTEKESSTERNETYCVASSSIQGWRVSEYLCKVVTLNKNFN